MGLFTLISDFSAIYEWVIIDIIFVLRIYELVLLSILWVFLKLQRHRRQSYRVIPHVNVRVSE